MNKLNKKQLIKLDHYAYRNSSFSIGHRPIRDHQLYEFHFYVDPYETGNFFKAYVKCTDKTLTMRIQHNNGVPEMSDLIMDKIEVMGVSSAGVVYVNDYLHDTFTYDPATRVR